jgi:competence protein ComEA
VAAGLLLLCALGGAAFLLWPRPPPPLAVFTPVPRPSPSPGPSPQALIAVHVTGAVASPGVYRLQSGSRAEDAVVLAGGLTEDADAASLNLAARLADGQQLVVRPKLAGAAERSSAADAGGGRINLNLASIAELDTLPGVGPALAQRIVERRQRSGPYESVEQLRDERILPGSTYERVRDRLTVE